MLLNPLSQSQGDGSNDNFDPLILAVAKNNHMMGMGSANVNANTQEKSISRNTGTQERKRKAQAAFNKNEKQTRDERDAVERITLRKSPESLSRKNRNHNTKDINDTSLEQDSNLGAHGNEGDVNHFSSNWNIRLKRRKSFEERVAELVAFKAKHGHYNVSTSTSNEYKSLFFWCGIVRYSYKQIKEGKTPRHPLSQDQIERLEALGFEWRRNFVFEKRLAELAALKAKHGHCNTSTTRSSESRSLGRWCSEIRSFYKQIKEGKTPRRPLPQSQIERLEALGFRWSNKKGTHVVFEERLAELAVFKAIHGHCNASSSSLIEYKSLGVWCSHMRVYYKKIKEGKTPCHLLSQDQIRRLEALDFQW